MRHATVGFAAAVLVTSANADARFAPRENQAYRETLTEIHDDGTGAERFTIERSILFARDGEGWVATVTFGQTGQSAKTGTTAMFQRAMAALAGTTIRYRLDSTGTVTAIDDEALQWQRFVATVAAMGGADEAQSRDTAAIAEALATLPGEQRRGLLSEPIAAVLAPAEAERGAQASATIKIPARSTAGVAADLPGTTSATETAETVRIVSRGEGPLVIAGTQPARMRIARFREIDKVTGLLRNAHEETVTDIPTAGRAARQSVTRTIVLTY